MANLIATGGYSVKNIFDGDPAKSYRLYLDSTAIIKNNLNQTVSPSRVTISNMEVTGFENPVPFLGYVKIFKYSNAGMTREAYNQLYTQGKISPENLYVIGETSNLLIEAYRSSVPEAEVSYDVEFSTDSTALYIYLYKDPDFEVLLDLATVSITSDGTKVKEIVVEYKLDTQGLTPPTSGWALSIPAPSPGKYLWTRVTTEYDDGQTSSSYSVGGFGTSGVNARAVQLMSPITVISYNALGLVPLMLTIPITATSVNTEGTPYYEFLVDGVSKQQGTSATYTYNASPTFSGASTAIEVRLREDSNVGSILAKDILTISEIKPGQDAYTIALSNESHTFPGLENSAAAGSTNTKVIAYKGSTKIPVTIGTITGKPHGMDISVTGDQVNISVTTSLVAFGGELIIPITADGKSFEKKFTFAVSRKGTAGISVTGITEYYLVTSAISGVTRLTDGWSTSIPTMTSTKRYLWNYEVVTYSAGDPSPTTPVIVGVYGEKGNPGGTGATGRSITGIVENYLATPLASGVTRTTPGWSTAPQPTTPTNKYLWNFETITWSSGTTPTYVEPFLIGVHGEEGKKGDPGDPGSPGLPGYTLVLTNESHTFAGGVGAVLPGSTTSSIIAYKGADRVGATIGTLPAITGMTITKLNNGKTTAGLKFDVLTSLSPLKGDIVIPITVDGKPMSKTFSYSVALKGAGGLPGSDGYTVNLSKESYVFSGGVTNAIAGQSTTIDVTAFKGLVAANVQVGTISGKPTGLTTSLSTTSSAAKVVITVSVAGNMSTASGSLTIPITVDGTTFLRSFTYGLALKGSNGLPGVSIASVDVWYYLSTSETSLLGGSWSTAAPAWADETYMWTKTVTTYSGGSPTPKPTSSDPVCITGAKGGVGNSGRGITSITEQYALTKDKESAPSRDSSLWKDTPPTWIAGWYMWTRSKIVYNNPTSTDYAGTSVDTAWEAVNEIEVGGRNLFSLHHLNSLSSSSWTVRAYLYEFWLKPNTEYILSTNLPEGQNSLYFNGGDAADRMVDVSQSLIRMTDEEGYLFIAVPVGRPQVPQIFSGEYWVKLERGNIVTDWTPAPEDIETRFVTHEARFIDNETAIGLRATKTEANAIDKKIEDALLLVTPDAITSVVRSSTEYVDDQGKKVSANEIISKINQSAELIQIEAIKVNIKGKVTFESFDSSTAAEINAKAKTFVAKPTPPYSAGDIWKDVGSTKIAKVTRASGSFVTADWELTGDVTNLNTAANTNKVGNTAATTVESNAKKGADAKTRVDDWTYTGKTTIDGGDIETDTIKAAQILAGEIKATHLAADAVIAGKIAAGAVTAGTIAAGAIDATVISAIKSNIGTLTAGKIQSKDGLSVWDLDNSTLTLKVNKLSIGSTNVATALSGKTDKGQSSVFNELMGTGGSKQGIYLEGGKVKIDGELIKANSIGAGVLTANAIDTTVINAVRGKFGPIGGKNLLEINKVEPYINAYVRTGYTFRVSASAQGGLKLPNNAIEPRTEYALSFKTKKISGNVTTMAGHTGSITPTNFSMDGQDVGTGFSCVYPNDTKEHQFVLHFVSTSTITDWVYIQPNRSHYGSAYVMDIWDIQLEKGNIVTDWSPHPSELIAGATHIDETGVLVTEGGKSIRTKMQHDGLTIMDGTTDIAKFGDIGAMMPEADIAVLRTPDAVLNCSIPTGKRYSVGYNKEYPNISAVFMDIFGVTEQVNDRDEFRTHLVNDPNISIDVETDIQDDVRLWGIHGSGRIYIWFKNGSTLNGSISIQDNTCRIYIRQSSGHPRGKIVDSKKDWATVVVLNSAFLMLIGIDLDANGNTYGIGGNDGGVTVLQDFDCSGATIAAVRAFSGHTVRAFNSRGNAPKGYIAQNGGAVYLTGTTIKGSSMNYHAILGHVVTEGTLSPLDSAFIKPPLTNKVFTYEVPVSSLETYNYTQGFVSTYYGNNAAQGFYKGMSGWLEGRVTFGTNVASKFAGGSSIKTYLKLRRKSSGGNTAAVKPKPYGFSATWSTGATMGGWTSYALVPYSLFSASSNTTFKFRGTVTDSDYAIWSSAMVKVEVTKRV